MWYMSVQERCIIIQNGWLNKVELKMTLRYRLLWVTKKTNHVMVVKKGGVAKIFDSKSAMK